MFSEYSPSTIDFPVAKCLSCPLTVGVEVNGDERKGYFIFDTSHLSPVDAVALQKAITMVTDKDPGPSEESSKLIFHTLSDRYSGHYADAVQFLEIIANTCGLEVTNKSFPQAEVVAGLFNSRRSMAIQYPPVNGTSHCAVINTHATKPLRKPSNFGLS